MTFQIDWTKNQLIVCGPNPKSNDVYSFKLAMEVLTKSVSHDYITMMCKHKWLSEQLLQVFTKLNSNIVRAQLRQYDLMYFYFR